MATDFCYFLAVVGDPPKEVSLVLESFRGDEAALDQRLFETTYGELRRLAGFLMAREPPGHTLQATALVNEAYLKLVGGKPVDWKNRRHFVNTVARAMRQVLTDRARRVARARHGGDRRRVDPGDISAGVAESFPLERAEELERALARLEAGNPRWAEVVHLRFFAGLTIEQTAGVMEVSTALVKKDWKFARACLMSALEPVGRTVGPGGKP